MPHVILDRSRRLLCDFCSEPTPRGKGARLPAESFTLYNLLTRRRDNLIGDWLACPTCWRLIRRDARAKLRQRALDRQGPMTRPLRAATTKHLRRLHDAFFRHWSGNALPTEVREPSDGLAFLTLPAKGEPEQGDDGKGGEASEPGDGEG